MFDTWEPDGSIGAWILFPVTVLAILGVTAMTGADPTSTAKTDERSAEEVQYAHVAGSRNRDTTARVSSLLAYMDEKGDNIVAALRTMPAEKYDFVPAEGQRTFRQQAFHVAEMNYAVCSAVTGEALPNPGMRHDSPKPELIAGMVRSFEYCREVLTDADDSILSGTFRTPDGKTLSKARLVYFLVGNWADHYGHFATHLRMNDLTTPDIWDLPAVILQATTRR